MVEAELRLEEHQLEMERAREHSALKSSNGIGIGNNNGNGNGIGSNSPTALPSHLEASGYKRSGSSSTHPLTDYECGSDDNDLNNDINDNNNNSSNNMDDDAVARRIQQELEDAEYAARLGLTEQQELASQGVLLDHQMALAQQEQRQLLQDQPQRSCLARWWTTIFCLALSVTIPTLFVLGVFDPSDVPFFGDLFGDDWVGNDPWSGTDMKIDLINGTAVPRLPGNAYGWANSGTGLSLDLLNACSDDYQPFVQEAIANWEQGDPIDSLTLYSTRIEYETECSTVTGKLKICNGDYGDTRWRGLNEVLLSPRLNTIVSSTAKLNEYYLNYESDDQKLYTCCHEIGHGFGLPHWDEDFFNKDLGNCMDYTQRPGASKSPDASNFLYLAQLYGGRDAVTNDVITANQAQAMAEKDPTTMAGQDGEDYAHDDYYTYSDDDDDNETDNDKNHNNDDAVGKYYIDDDVLQQPIQNKKRDKEDANANAKVGNRNRNLELRPRNTRGLRSTATATATTTTVAATVTVTATGNSRVKVHGDGAKRTRRVLKTTKDFEVHLIKSDEFPDGLVLLQHYLLVRE